MPKKPVTPSASPTSLRPIGARALKSVMDTLRPYLPGSKILDLFAGQGRFSYGALLEGAQSAILVEKHAPTAHSLLKLRPKKIPAERTSRVVCEDVWKFLDRDSTDLYDVIFADPPFRDWNEAFEKTLFQKLTAFSKRGTILLVKYPSEMLISSEHTGFKLWKINHFGESQLAYFNYGES